MLTIRLLRAHVVETVAGEGGAVVAASLYSRSIAGAHVATLIKLKKRKGAGDTDTYLVNIKCSNEKLGAKLAIEVAGLSM